MDSEKRLVLTRVAVGLLNEGLALRPAGGYAWSRLAQLELSHGRVERGVNALKMSHENALYDDRLAPSRLHVGLKLYSRLDEKLRRKVAREFLYAFDANPQYVVRLAWHDSEIPSAVKDILLESPERLESFESMYDPFSRIAQE
jgi:hypothetical protein